jgi:hypothetical protein
MVYREAGYHQDYKNRTGKANYPGGSRDRPYVSALEPYMCTTCNNYFDKEGLDGKCRLDDKVYYFDNWCYKYESIKPQPETQMQARAGIVAKDKSLLGKIVKGFSSFFRS